MNLATAAVLWISSTMSHPAVKHCHAISWTWSEHFNPGYICISFVASVLTWYLEILSPANFKDQSILNWSWLKLFDAHFALLKSNQCVYPWLFCLLSCHLNKNFDSLRWVSVFKNEPINSGFIYILLRYLDMEVSNGNVVHSQSIDEILSPADFNLVWVSIIFHIRLSWVFFLLNSCNRFGYANYAWCAIFLTSALLVNYIKLPCDECAKKM